MDLKEMLNNMTLEEKVGQLFQLHARWFCDTTADLTGPNNWLKLSPEEISSCGSVLNFNGASEMITAQDTFMARTDRQIPLMFMQNVVHGHKTVYPVPLGMGATFNPDLMYECCDMAAKEAAASGVHVTFAPMLDLVRDARWGRVVESTGEDPYLNCEMAKSFVKGFQGNFKKKHNIAVCVKHFAAYGCPEAGRDYNTVDVSERNLREYYLPAYKAAVDAGAEMIMTSFNTLNGVPASGNEWILKKILREEWGYDKLVISDFNSIKEMIAHGYCKDDEECAVRAMNCELDIEMMSTTYIKSAKKLLDEGKITMELIDRMVMRVLKLKDKLGLFDNRYTEASIEAENKIFLSRKHREIARRAAEESIVMLKNDGALPLNKTEKIALIGPFADSGEILGSWRSIGDAKDSVTLYAGMKKHTYTRNIYLDAACSHKLDDLDDSGFKKAIAKMKKSDKVVLAIGEHQTYSGEGRSRAKLHLPPLHTKLAVEAKKLSKPVIAVVFAGRPLELETLSELCDSIVYVWFPGTEGGNAIANILYGKVNPSGKLTMSFPYTVGQEPLYYNCFATGRPKAAGDKIPSDMGDMPCTSMYGDVKNAPLYHFGYGLSYTSFDISEPTLSADKMTRDGSITVTATVTNTGAVAGKEVVQLYLRDKFASVVRPLKELKGFQKVCLEPGESKTVTFTITDDMLKFYNQDMQYVSENGEFTVMVGNSSECYKEATFELVD